MRHEHGQRQGYLPLGFRGNQQAPQRVLDARHGHCPTQQAPPHHPLQHRHGPRGHRRALRRANLLPLHASRRHLLPQSRHLQPRPRPAQSQHARPRVLRRHQTPQQTHHPLPPHDPRPQAGPRKNVQVRPGQRHLHGGLRSRGQDQNQKGLLPPRRRRRQPMPRLHPPHGAAPPRLPPRTAQPRQRRRQDLHRLCRHCQRLPVRRTPPGRPQTRTHQSTQPNPTARARPLSK
mmetsp:Transcript_13837/g.34088  ORF Transcript_13837/g.34088 Transcript_13837/m.34088 type:complete len:232 (-) Transcript_13837:87-782(-)